MLMNKNSFSFDPEAVTRAFKAYDVRGRVPSELNEDIIKRTGNAFVQFLGTIQGPIIIGYDVRPTSKIFAEALIEGINDAGIDVLDIGLVGTDMVYFAVAKYQASGGIMITASHNPADYNGLKFVREQAIPVSGNTGLMTIRDLVLELHYIKKDKKGKIKSFQILEAYLDHILTFVDIEKIPPLKVVLNAGNGCAGIILPALLKKIPQIDVIPLFWELDGTFPNGIPNPLLPERREDTARKVRETNADLGVAWDGDFDRCFFYDEQGTYIDGYYIVALFSDFFTKKQVNAKIIHDPRLVWAIKDVVTAAGGQPIEHQAGHTFIKDRMRKEDAIYAGEMSAHHYFRDNYYADNGMIPLLLLLQILGESAHGPYLQPLVQQWIKQYPISGEINIKVHNADAIFEQIEANYTPQAKNIKFIDGLSFEYDLWRFNLRKSNTEPVIRLNIESRGDFQLMEQKKDELLQAIQKYDSA